MPTYIRLKDVKKRWGKGQEDIFPVAQFEKLWGDMTLYHVRRFTVRLGITLDPWKLKKPGGLLSRPVWLLLLLLLSDEYV